MTTTPKDHHPLELSPLHKVTHSVYLVLSWYVDVLCVWIVMSQYMLLGGRHLYMYVPFGPHAPFSCSATWQESRPLSSITSSDGSTTSVYSVYCLHHTTTSHCLHQPHSSRDDHTPWTSHGSTHRYVTCNWVANKPSSLVLSSRPASHCSMVSKWWPGNEAGTNPIVDFWLCHTVHLHVGSV